MNELGRTGQGTTDQRNRAMASERGAWRPVGGPAPRLSYQPPPSYPAQPQWRPGEAARDPRGAVRPPNAGPYRPGPQIAGPQNYGPQIAGPQIAGPQNYGPRHAGPQQPMPAPARPPMGAAPAVQAPPVIDGPPAPRGRGRVGRWIAAGVVVAALGGVGWYVTVGAPAPVTAAVGDCVAQDGQNDVRVVGCGEPAARFRVAGKVEDKTMIAASLFACSDFPTATSSFWQGVDGKPGTVLCLAPLHP